MNSEQAAPWRVNEEGEFTMPRGMPRPLYDNQPVPYTSDHLKGMDGEVSISVANLNTDRSRECQFQGLCMLCGDKLTERSAVIAVYGDGSYEPLPKTPQNRAILESGAFHERCAKMSMRHCPHLRDDPNCQQPEIWIGPTRSLRTGSGKVPKGWRRLKTTAERRVARQQPIAA